MLAPGFEANLSTSRTKKRLKKDLSLDELKKILWLVTEKGFCKVQVAELFNVKPDLITRLLRNERAGKRSVAKLVENAKAKL